MNGPELVAKVNAADDAPLEEEFEVAAERLVDESALLTVDQLAVRARQTRALLDLDVRPLVRDRVVGLR